MSARSPFFRNDAIEFYWRDPEPGAREPIKIPDPATVWHAYYSPFVEVIRSFAEPIGGAPEPPGLLQIAELDLSIRVHPAIALSVFKADWQRAHEEAKERSEEFASDGYQPDGLLVKAGPSWLSGLKCQSFDEGGHDVISLRPHHQLRLFRGPDASCELQGRSGY